MSMDAFDSFLQTYRNKDLSVLVREGVGQETNRGRQRPPEPINPPPSKRMRLEEADALTEPPTPTAQPASESSSSTMPLPASQSTPLTMPPPDQSEEMQRLAASIAELTRKVHNQGRGGRNKLYYEILHMHGADAAAPFWKSPGHFCFKLIDVIR